MSISCSFLAYFKMNTMRVYVPTELSFKVNKLPGVKLLSSSIPFASKYEISGEHDTLNTATAIAKMVCDFMEPLFKHEVPSAPLPSPIDKDIMCVVPVVRNSLRMIRTPWDIGTLRCAGLESGNAEDHVVNIGVAHGCFGCLEELISLGVFYLNMKLVIEKNYEHGVMYVNPIVGRRMCGKKFKDLEPVRAKYVRDKIDVRVAPPSGDVICFTAFHVIGSPSIEKMRAVFTDLELLAYRNVW